MKHFAGQKSWSQTSFFWKGHLYSHWRRTKVETTGATQDYETLISRLFETFLYFEIKKQVVPWHQWHHLVRRHCIYYLINIKKKIVLLCFDFKKNSKLIPSLTETRQQDTHFFVHIKDKNTLPLLLHLVKYFNNNNSFRYNLKTYFLKAQKLWKGICLKVNLMIL